jgi:predicted outer membrane protein
MRRKLASLAAALAASAVLGACGGDMRRDELNRSIESLQSSAGDGELTAFGAARDRTKTTFVRVHAREISEDVDHEAEKLNDAFVKPDVKPYKQRAVELADLISDALGRLRTSPQDEEVARQVRQQLRDLADQAQQLRDEL